jgi:hypothetical protein
MCRLTCVRQTATPLQIAPYILYIIFILFIAFSEVKRTNSHTTTPARSDHHCNLLHMPFSTAALRCQVLNPKGLLDLVVCCLDAVPSHSTLCAHCTQLVDQQQWVLGTLTTSHQLLLLPAVAGLSRHDKLFEGLSTKVPHRHTPWPHRQRAAV